MGFQIPGPTKGKVQYFVGRYQAMVLDGPPDNFDKVQDPQAIICVIDTLQYEVASYAFSRQEFSLLDDLLRDKQGENTSSHPDRRATMITQTFASAHGY
jgi:hypothetical protein